jgi:hypothetical protein
LFNTSEILPVSGATLTGPLPPDLQTYIVFDAAIPAGAAAPAPAASFIATLVAPAERQAWQKAGLEPLGAAQAQYRYGSCTHSGKAENACGGLAGAAACK